MTDRCGLKFVLKSVEEARTLSAEVCWMLDANGAFVTPDGDNLTEETATAADPDNAHASPKYRKKQISVLWNGRVYEIQFVLFSGYYAALYALDDENHDIYKLRKALGDVLPLLYPGSIYLDEGTWDDPGLRQMLRDRLIETLGWNRERHLRNGKH